MTFTQNVLSEKHLLKKLFIFAFEVILTGENYLHKLWRMAPTSIYEQYFLNMHKKIDERSLKINLRKIGKTEKYAVLIDFLYFWKMAKLLLLGLNLN